MSNLKRYGERQNKFCIEQLLPCIDGEYVKFDDIKEFLPTDKQLVKGKINPCGNMVCEYHAVDSISGCLTFDINGISLCESYYSKS
jgi:hypothetical protein